MTARVQIPQSHKFALLSLPGRNAGYEGPEVMDLGGGLYFSRSLPFNAPSRVAERVGSISYDRLSRAGFYLLALQRSEAPDLLDDENQHLKTRVYRLYLGLLVSAQYFSHGQPLLLTGANTHGPSDFEASIRSYDVYERTFHSVGSPRTRVTAAQLREAAGFSAALEELNEQETASRLHRIVGTFRAACCSGALDERLHQFVRAAEGFLDPPYQRAAAVFAERAQMLTKDQVREHYYQMYAMRSATEHLRGVLSRTAGTTLAEKEMTLARRAIEAEALARYCLWEFLGNRDLWPHYQTDAAVAAFWAQNHGAIRRIWRTRMLLSAATRDFPKLYAQDRERYS